MPKGLVESKTILMTHSCQAIEDGCFKVENKLFFSRISLSTYSLQQFLKNGSRGWEILIPWFVFSWKFGFGGMNRQFVTHRNVGPNTATFGNNLLISSSLKWTPFIGGLSARGQPLEVAISAKSKGKKPNKQASKPFTPLGGSEEGSPCCVGIIWLNADPKNKYDGYKSVSFFSPLCSAQEMGKTPDWTGS